VIGANEGLDTVSHWVGAQLNSWRCFIRPYTLHPRCWRRPGGQGQRPAATLRRRAIVPAGFPGGWKTAERSGPRKVVNARSAGATLVVGLGEPHGAPGSLKDCCAVQSDLFACGTRGFFRWGIVHRMQPPKHTARCNDDLAAAATLLACAGLGRSGSGSFPSRIPFQRMAVGRQLWATAVVGR